MKITNAKVIVSCPDRNFVTLKINTDEGVYGIGDATVNGRELAVVAYLEEHLIPCLIGKDPQNIEDIWQYFYKGAYWRRGPITMAAISAVDVALWDIKAKMAGLPLYQLLGGKSRNGILVYGHANGSNTEEVVEQVGQYLEKGYKAIRVQCSVPGVQDSYGVSSKDKTFYEPASSDLPTECSWNSSKYVQFIPGVFAKLRDTYGYEPEFLHDVHHRLTPIQAAHLGKLLEPYRLFWLEDAVPAELQEGFRIIRKHTTIPLAVGEVFNSIFDCTTLITEQLIDYIRTTATHAGGITGIRKIAALAEPFHVKTACHGPTDISPVGMAACLHFDLAVPNFGIQEFMLHTEKINDVFPNQYQLNNGYASLNDVPGHGADIDEKQAAKYPYQRKFLPVNRLEDGTMWSW
ncbi:MAG: D-galactonate dehydratase family protein [Haliscomenobacter sp.]|nr:D-galactonate dehydratase family protein [Haliscomenobacter sp.]